MTTDMTLILTLGCLIAAGIAASERTSSKDKFLLIVMLGIVCGVASLFQ